MRTLTCRWAQHELTRARDERQRLVVVPNGNAVFKAIEALLKARKKRERVASLVNDGATLLGRDELFNSTRRLCICCLVEALYAKAGDADQIT